jgi:hypothetical protein
MPWRVLKQAGRTPLILSALRNAPVSFAPLPKLDVAGSSPVARSVKLQNEHLLNWPAEIGRPCCKPPTVTATEIDRGRGMFPVDALPRGERRHGNSCPREILRDGLDACTRYVRVECLQV